MSYENKKTNSNCPGGRHHISTIGNEGHTTETGRKVFIDKGR